MKRFFLALVLACAIALPGVSNAATGMYLAPKFLMTVQNTGTLDRSRNFGGFGMDSYSQFTLGGALAAGYDFWPQNMFPLRVEVEFALRGNSEVGWSGPGGFYSDGTFNSTTLLANVYYDFHNSTNFTPYVGAGIGMAFNYMGIDVGYEDVSRSFDDWNTNLAWQVGAGVAYSFNENVAVDVAYRYLDLGYTEVSTRYGSVGIRPYNHEIMLGLRFGF